MKSMNLFALIILLSISQQIRAEWELTEACSPHTEILTYAETATKIKLDAMMEQFSAYTELSSVIENSKIANELDKVIDKVECMQSKHSKVRIICEESDRCKKMNNDDDKFNIVAHVNWVGHTIYVCPSIFSKKRKKTSVRNILIHEMSHLCGTLDLEYLKNSKKVKTYPREQYSDLFSFSMNADNYDYWAGKGACLPGVDCPESTREWYGFKDLKNILKF